MPFKQGFGQDWVSFNNISPYLELSCLWTYISLVRQLLNMTGYMCLYVIRVYTSWCNHQSFTKTRKMGPAEFKKRDSFEIDDLKSAHKHIHVLKTKCILIEGIVRKLQHYHYLSSKVIRLMAIPRWPYRPDRPILCRYVSACLGKSKLITTFTAWMSIPLVNKSTNNNKAFTRTSILRHTATKYNNVYCIHILARLVVLVKILFGPGYDLMELALVRECHDVGRNPPVQVVFNCILTY